MLLRGVLSPHAVLAAVLLTSVPSFAFAQDNTHADGSAAGGSSGDAGGAGNSSANQSDQGSVSTDSNGPDASASASSTDSGTASNTAGPVSASSTTTANADASLQSGVATATGTATGVTQANVPGPNDASKSVEATATATFDPNAPNSASASTKVDNVTTTSADATLGVSANAFAPGGTEYEKVGSSKSVAVAILSDGTYSVAVAGKTKSFAKAGVYAKDAQTLLFFRNLFKGNDAYAAARTAASAYAIAAGDFAKAGARSRGEATARDDWGWATAESKSRARVCVGSGCLPASPAAQPRVVVARFDCRWRELDRILECPHIPPFPSGHGNFFAGFEHNASVAFLRSPARHAIHKNIKKNTKKKHKKKHH